MKYKLSKGIYKGIKYMVIFTIPFLVDSFIIQFPEYAQLTVGGLLVIGANWLKVKGGVKI